VADASPTRLLLVDDHEIFTSSLVAALETEPGIEVSGVAHDLAAARRMLPARRPDVVLLDHRLPDGDGVAAIRDLRALHDAQFVVLTASTADQVLMAAIEAGAAGFVSKTRSLRELVSAVHAAAAGEAVISSDLLARLLPRLRGIAGAAPTTALTPREVEVLQLMASGLANSAIAEELVVSVHTVRNHVANLSAKLDAHSKLEAVSIGVRQGLISID
jgi:DNA-binding NarL/FixJ family response regulator